MVLQGGHHAHAEQLGPDDAFAGGDAPVVVPTDEPGGGRRFRWRRRRQAGQVQRADAGAEPPPAGEPADVHLGGGGRAAPSGRADCAQPSGRNHEPWVDAGFAVAPDLGMDARATGTSDLRLEAARGAAARAPADREGRGVEVMRGGLTIVLVAIVLLLVLRQQRTSSASGVPGPTYVPGNPSRGPEALYDPTVAQGGPSTRQQIEVGVGTAVGAGAGLYVCGGNPLCASGGAYIGGTIAPYVSHGAEAAGKGIAHGAEAAWNATLGRLF